MSANMNKDQVEEMYQQFIAMKLDMEQKNSEETLRSERNARQKQFSVALRTLPRWREERSGEGGTFRVHLDAMRRWFMGNPVEGAQEKKLALISSIQGRAAERLKPVDDQSTCFLDVSIAYEEYASRVKEIFIPISEREMSRSSFKLRRQAPEEDAASYFGNKYALFSEAYENVLDSNFPEFRDCLIEGLVSIVVKRQLSRARCETVDETRAALYKIVASERTAFMSGYGEATSLDGLAAVSRGEFAMRTYTVDGRSPMDISTLGGQRPEREGRQEEISYLHNDGNTGTGRKCFQCNSTDHIKRNCPEARRGEPVQEARGQNRGGRPGVDKALGCTRCGRNNHMIGTCRALRHLNGTTLPVGNSGHGRTGNIRKLEEFREDVEDEDEDEDARNYLDSQGIQAMGMGFLQGRSGL